MFKFLFKQDRDAFEERFGKTQRICEVLGQGKFGVVLSVKVEIKPGTIEQRAVKAIAKSKIKTKELRRFMDNEIKIHSQIMHPHIVVLHETFEDNKTIFMVMEKLFGGPLFERIMQLQSFSEKKAALVLRNVAEALCYLHEIDIVHRDIKPENLILCDKRSDTDLKLCDFGFAANCEKDLTEGCGTVDYIAPEVLGPYGYGREIDIWGLGVIFFFLLFGVPPFNGNTDSDTARNIIKREFTIPENGWKICQGAKELVLKMLSPRAQRITAKEILEHEFVVKAEELEEKEGFQVVSNLKKFKTDQLLRKALRRVVAVDRLRQLVLVAE